MKGSRPLVYGIAFSEMRALRGGRPARCACVGRMRAPHAPHAPHKACVCAAVVITCQELSLTHTHTRAHAHAHKHTHTRTRTYTRTHACTAGKTHTMDGGPTPELQGLIPNAFKHIFEEVTASDGLQWMVRASYLEIYNEEVRPQWFGVCVRKNKYIYMQRERERGRERQLGGSRRRRPRFA